MNRRFRALPAMQLVAWMFTLAWCSTAPVGATTVAPPDFPTLVNDSDYIVQAIVKRVSAEEEPGPGATIVTHVELQIVQTIAGTPPATVTLELLGGQIGQRRLTVEGMPRFAVGDEDILFVSGNGQTICPLNRMRHGRYPILQDATTGRKYVARADHTPLRSTAEVQQPLGERRATALPPAAETATALTPEEFIQQIRANIQPGSRLDHAR